MKKNQLHSKIPFENLPFNCWVNLSINLTSYINECFKNIKFRCIENIVVSGECKFKRIFTMKNGSLLERNLNPSKFKESIPKSFEITANNYLCENVNLFVNKSNSNKEESLSVENLVTESTNNYSNNNLVNLRVNSKNPTTGKKRANSQSKFIPSVKQQTTQYLRKDTNSISRGKLLLKKEKSKVFKSSDKYNNKKTPTIIKASIPTDNNNIKLIPKYSNNITLSEKNKNTTIASSFFLNTLNFDPSDHFEIDNPRPDTIEEIFETEYKDNEIIVCNFDVEKPLFNAKNIINQDKTTISQFDDNNQILKHKDLILNLLMEDFNKDIPNLTIARDTQYSPPFSKLSDLLNFNSNNNNIKSNMSGSKSKNLDYNIPEEVFYH